MRCTSRMRFMPFLFMGFLKDYLCLPWFGPAACQSSCPFQRRECRLPANGFWSDESNQTHQPNSADCSSLLPSDSAPYPPPYPLDTGPAMWRAAAVCAGAENKTLLLPLLSFISLRPPHINFPSPRSPSCPRCSEFAHPTDQPRGTSSMDRLEPCQPGPPFRGGWWFC